MTDALTHDAWERLQAKVRSLVSDPQCTNKTRRYLHAEVELFVLDQEEKSGDGMVKLPGKEDTIDSLNLVPVKNSAWWYWFDVGFRFFGVVLGIVTLGLLFPLLIMLLKVVDYPLVKLGFLTPFTLTSEMARRFLSRFLLVLSGVEIDVSSEETSSSTVDQSYFNESCVILTFSHSSNLDGFFVSSTCPVQHYAIAKKELFVVPFFSWLAFATGGIPVDRGNRDHAVNALKAAAESAQNSKSCVVIAPEGTRSTTGQLLPFKKGVFHTWEQLQVPIVPFVTFGGYDLYPVGSWVNQCGKVYIKYLKPILPNEATSREDMHRLLKRRMLLAMKECPENVAGGISWSGRVTNTVCILVVLGFDYFSLKFLHQLLFVDLQYSVQTVVLYIVVISLAITFVLYTFFVHIGELIPSDPPFSLYFSLSLFSFFLSSLSLFSFFLSFFLFFFFSFFLSFFLSRLIFE